MKIGIIGAMEEEIRLLKSSLVELEIDTQAGFTFYQGHVGQHDVVLVQSGIGKVNATLSVALLKQLYDVQLIINTGSAGGMNPQLKVGDIVIADRLIHHDVDVTAFGYQYGQMAGMPASYPIDDKLRGIAQNVCVSLGLPVHQGLIVSGDTFVQGHEHVAPIRERFPTVYACEMESAAIAQATYVLEVPCLIIRAISDLADEAASMSFDEFIVLAGKQSATLVLALIEAIA